MTPDQPDDAERPDDADHSDDGRPEDADSLDPMGASEIGPIGTDELFEVLARPGNRYVLTYLLLKGEPISIVDLVDYVLEATEPPSGMDRAEFSGQLLNRFIETVLPELDERGLVEYDPKTQMIAETEATALTLPYLRAGLQQSSPQAPERRT